MKTYTTFIADIPEFKEIELTEEQFNTLPRIKRPYTMVSAQDDITFVFCEELIETPDGLAMLEHTLIGYVYGVPCTKEELNDSVFAACNDSYHNAIKYQFDRFVQHGETFLHEKFYTEEYYDERETHA